MSGIFDLDLKRQQKLDADAALNPLDLTAAPILPAWEGAGEALKGLTRPAASFLRTTAIIGGATPGAQQVKFVMGDEWFDDHYYRPVVGWTQDVVDANTPDAQSMGSAARALSAVSQVGGSLPFLFASPPAFLADSAVSPSVDLVDQGVDAKTAIAVGEVNLAANAVGLKLPNAIGSTVATRMASGASINVATGAATDAASAEALRLGGYDQQAEGFKATDATARTMDLLLGAFMPLAEGRAPPAQRDAALAARNAVHFNDATMPGTPATRNADVAHVDALGEAIRQLSAGNPVDVSNVLRAEDFILRPEVDPALPEPRAPDAYSRMLVALESGGKADAKAPTSSATGLHQFTEATWRRVVAEAKPAWAEGLTDTQLLAARTDPAKSAQMEQALRAENARALEAAGQPVTPFNLYAAHHFGAGGGVKFARAAGDTPMSEILSPAQLKANPYLKGKTKAEAIANWTARAGGRKALASPDDIEAARTREALAKFDVPEEAVAAATRTAPRDGVTGYFDGRTDSAKFDAIHRAQTHVAETGEPAVFVSADLFNLGGLNAHVGNRAEAANVHFKAMADALETELRATGADVVPMRTGGDELGIVVANADHATVQGAVDRATARIGDYARAQGLADIPHPKRSGEKGVGLHVGLAPITPQHSVRAILDRADDGVNLSKIKAAPDVTRSATGKAGTEPPGGQTRRTAGGNGAADRGVRSAGAEPAAKLGTGAGGRPEQGDLGQVSAAETPLAAAQRAAAGSPQLSIIDGFDADGEPRYRPLSDALADIDAERAQAVKDAEAFPAAVNCYLRRGDAP